jgi:hypothetical protein
LERGIWVARNETVDRVKIEWAHIHIYQKKWNPKISNSNDWLPRCSKIVLKMG